MLKNLDEIKNEDLHLTFPELMDTPKNLYDWKGGVYMGERNRHFTREFKLDAVQLVTEKGMPVGKVARDLDIHPNLLHLWRRRFMKDGDKAFVGKGRVQPEAAEIKRLRAIVVGSGLVF